MAEEKSTTTAVSLKADEPYMQSVRALAKQRGTTIGELVREAIDAKFGTELEPFVIFFTQNGNPKNQSAKQIVNTGPGAA